MTTLLIAWAIMSAFNAIYGYLRGRQRGFTHVTVEDGYAQGLFASGFVSLVVAGVAAVLVGLGVIH